MKVREPLGWGCEQQGHGTQQESWTHLAPWQEPQKLQRWGEGEVKAGAPPLSWPCTLGGVQFVSSLFSYNLGQETEPSWGSVTCRLGH